ncbi:hypothetical protein Enr13x_59880 [Stieleria neptunia]|uniref:Uncharacterized protein n=1 Tax=Stieleria neptunia TaxID=2527979 RepID=A0A518HZ85_9BACT|nr:hypothetical protein [Stieleria neptunia]QDV46084.1 hypothetical protein Enr13x_59880 [Stieleria neptunia]
MKISIALSLALLVVACPVAGDEPKELLTQTRDAMFQPHPDGKRWSGVYASTSEVGMFTSTVLVIDDGSVGHIAYNMKFTTDVGSVDDIRQDTLHGTVLTDKDKIYVPLAHGRKRDGQISLMASISRYTRVEINGKTVLLRDDALRAYKKDKKLYDYGVLIRVADYRGMRTMFDIEKITHPSIKILYKDKSKTWSDPFVAGPNDGG